MKWAYINKTFWNSSLDLIAAMNAIIEGYQQQGYRLTVRQLYYQLVTRNRIANQEREYKRVTQLCNDARLAGLMDWDMLEDRTRAFVQRSRWQSGTEILQAVAKSYHEDRWRNQACRVFCVVGKDALSGVLEPVCTALDIPLLAAKGYPSVSVLHDCAIQMITPAIEEGQAVIILHLGDHDPSGLDMTRDLEDRLALFVESVAIHRLALTLDQVQELNPPENPVKTTDSRFADYVRRFGHSSWELDALSPEYLVRLVHDFAVQFIDEDAWQASEQAIRATQASLNQNAAAFAAREDTP